MKKLLILLCALITTGAACAQEGERPLIGWELGYVTKQWVYRSGSGDAVKRGFWNENASRLHGMQAGVRIEPHIVWWLYADTGLYYEFYYSQSKAESTLLKYMEHSLCIPARLSLRVPLPNRFSLYVDAGIGLDYAVYARVSAYSDFWSAPHYTETNVYGNTWWDAGDMNRFGLYGEFGGGLCFRNFRLGCTVSRGLLDTSADKNLRTVRVNKVAASFSMMF